MKELDCRDFTREIDAQDFAQGERDKGRGTTVERLTFKSDSVYRVTVFDVTPSKGEV